MSKAMECLPSLKGRMSFEYRDGGEILFTVRPDSGRDDPIRFTRAGGRWRYVSGPFVSIHTIGSQIFSYRENPSDDEMWFMSGFVEAIGDLADSTYEAIREGVEHIQQVRREIAQSKVIVYEHAGIEFQQFVYLMRHSNGLIKIGFSRNPQSREKTLQAEDPRLEMIFSVESERSTERRLHQIFDSLRVRGEWFRLAARHIDWIVFLLTNGETKKATSDGCFP